MGCCPSLGFSGTYRPAYTRQGDNTKPLLPSISPSDLAARKLGVKLPPGQGAAAPLASSEFCYLGFPLAPIFSCLFHPVILHLSLQITSSLFWNQRTHKTLSDAFPPLLWEPGTVPGLKEAEM